MTNRKLPVLHITTSLIGELADTVAKNRGLIGLDQARVVLDSAKLPPRAAIDALEKLMAQDKPDAE